MNKIEKLREVNATLKKILINMETRIFIEDINVENHKKAKESKPKVVIELK
jgi:hypothetical protein